MAATGPNFLRRQQTRHADWHQGRRRRPVTQLSKGIATPTLHATIARGSARVCVTRGHGHIIVGETRNNRRSWFAGGGSIAELPAAVVTPTANASVGDGTSVLQAAIEVPTKTTTAFTSAVSAYLPSPGVIEPVIAM